MNKRPWLKGRGDQGYTVSAAGTAGQYKYLTISIPLGQGFERGDRVYMKRITRGGVEGLFLTLAAPEKAE
jgi:hypothetical protein